MLRFAALAEMLRIEQPWLRAQFARVWESPTAATWLSLFTRSTSLLLVLPLVLHRFSEAEVAVWLVFGAVLAVQSVVGFGFGPSFGRLLSYARAGASVEHMCDLRHGGRIGGGEEVNWDSVRRLYACMRTIFFGLGAASVFLMATVGTFAVWRPIAMLDHRGDVWAAWAVIAAVSGLVFVGQLYVTYLQGMNLLLVWRRWETVLSLATIASNFVVLLAGGGIFALVISTQGWLLVGVWLFRRKCMAHANGRLLTAGVIAWEKSVFDLIWASAWKTGLTNVMTFGLVQLTGVIQAQVADAAATAAYNLVLRIGTAVGQFAQAPFITKIPELARLRAVGDGAGQLTLIRRGVRIVHWCILLAVVAVAVVAPIGLHRLNPAGVQFDGTLWLLFSINLFVERHGGMLQQMRNLTNQPMEHWAMFGYASIMISLLFILVPRIDAYGFPLSMLGAQLLYTFWFSCAVSYRTLGVSPIAFEKTVSIPPFLIAVLFFLLHTSLVGGAQ